MTPSTIRFLTILLGSLLLLDCTRVRRDFYPDGNLRSEISVRGDKYEGPAKFFYKDGSIQMQCSYSNDKLQGTLTRYYETGRIKEILFYRSGRPDSLHRLLSPEGTLLMECNYCDSLLDGPYKEYYPNGSIKIMGQYRKGLCDGMWLYYDPQGTVTGTEEFMNGAGIRKEYGSDGTIKKRTAVNRTEWLKPF